MEMQHTDSQVLPVPAAMVREPGASAQTALDGPAAHGDIGAAPQQVGVVGLGALGGEALRGGGLQAVQALYGERGGEEEAVLKQWGKRVRGECHKGTRLSRFYHT